MKDMRSEMKEGIASLGAGAYLLVDYEGRHPLLPHLQKHLNLTRKSFFLFGKDGSLRILAQALDAALLSSYGIDGEIVSYRTWKEQQDLLLKMTGKVEGPILMDISEKGSLMPVALADYGTVRFLIDEGRDIRSASSLVSTLLSHIDGEGFRSQREAADFLLEAKDRAFSLIGEEIRRNGESDELRIQRFLMDLFEQRGYVTDEPPIVAIGKNARSPHYSPSEESHSSIRKGDLILIDLWAKSKKEGSIYADITWMAYAGKDPADAYRKRFAVLREAADLCFGFIKEHYPTRPIHGYEADIVARSYIEIAGYGKHFTHRTGHSIAGDEGPHGKGTNLDDYETHDDRLLMDGTSFSIEPGIYAPDFGMRLETDVAIEGGVPRIVAGRQEDIVRIPVE